MSLRNLPLADIVHQNGFALQIHQYYPEQPPGSGTGSPNRPFAYQ